MQSSDSNKKSGSKPAPDAARLTGSVAHMHRSATSIVNCLKQHQDVTVIRNMPAFCETIAGKRYTTSVIADECLNAD